jgi:exopolyphosphatase/guanosine-5'-triphosphate,3'-diphosphate pyrophosphatase
VRIAALDLGSNSFHLLVADAIPGTQGPDIRLVERVREMVRLGAGSLVSGVIPDEGFERGLDALSRLRAVVARHEPETFLAVATSAIREASNGGEFVEAARAVIGADIQVVDGRQEALLVYFGARAALDLRGRRVALFDLGGGSLEIIVADERRIVFATSLKLGVLRLRNQWLADGAGGAVDRQVLARMREAVRAALAPAVAEARGHGFDFVALTAGTARAMRDLLAAPPPQAPSAPVLGALTLAALVELEARLAPLGVEACAVLPGVDPRRADTLLPGAMVLGTILELCGVPEATYCESALREGMIAAHLAGEWP